MRDKILSVVSLSLLLLLNFLTCCTTSDSVLTEDDKEAIYAAVVRQVYTIDNTCGDRRFAVIYLLRSTDDRTGDPRTTEARSQVLLESLQKAVVAALDNLPADFKWIDNHNEVIDRPTSLVEGGNGAIITLGNLHQQEDRTVLVSGSIYIANLAGGGMTYIIEKNNDIWEITGNTGVRWIS